MLGHMAGKTSICILVVTRLCDYIYIYINVRENTQRQIVLIRCECHCKTYFLIWILDISEILLNIYYLDASKILHISFMIITRMQVISTPLTQPYFR